MNNNITENYCSFEVSKLLKERGFDIWCYAGYGYNGKNQYTQVRNPDCIAYSKPTHALAIEWIRVNFGIHIWIEAYGFGYYWRIGNSAEPTSWNKDYRRMQFVDGSSLHTQRDQAQEPSYKTPQDAIEAALLYTLKHLI